MANKTPVASDVTPYTPPFPGSQTPGWNDPPTVLNNSNVLSGRTRLNLSKRVAFPLSGVDVKSTAAKPTAIVPPTQSSQLQPTTLSNNTSSGLPSSIHPIAVVHPMPNPNVTVPTHPPMVRIPPSPQANLNNVQLNISQIPASALPFDAREYSLRLLRGRVNLIQESLNIKRDEIFRRLDIAENLWRSNTMTMMLQEKIYQLAKKIEDNKFDDAMALYNILVTNHANECGSWSVGLRHIILTLKPPSALNVELITSELNNVPSMLVPAMPRQSDRGEILNTDFLNLQHI